MHDGPVKKLGTFCRVCFDVAGSQDVDAQAFAVLGEAMKLNEKGKIPDVMVETYTCSGSPMRIRTRDISALLLSTPESRIAAWDRDRSWAAEKREIAPDFIDDDEEEPYA